MGLEQSNLSSSISLFNDPFLMGLENQKKNSKNAEEIKNLDKIIQKRINFNIELLNLSYETTPTNSFKISSSPKANILKLKENNVKQENNDKNEEPKQKEIRNFKQFYEIQRDLIKNDKVGSYIYSKKLANKIKLNLETLARLKTNTCKLSYYKNGKIHLDPNIFFRPVRDFSRFLGFNKDFVDGMECLKKYTDFMKFYFNNVFTTNSLKRDFAILMEHAQEGIEKLEKELYEDSSWFSFGKSYQKKDLLDKSSINIEEIRKKLSIVDEEVNFEEEIRGLSVIAIQNKSLSPNQKVIFIARRIKILLDDSVNFPQESQLIKLQENLDIIKKHYALLVACLCLKQYEEEDTGKTKKYIENFCLELNIKINTCKDISRTTREGMLLTELMKLNEFKEILEEIEKIRKKDQNLKTTKSTKKIDSNEKLLNAVFVTISGAGLVTLGYLSPVKFIIPQGDEFMRRGADEICDQLLQTEKVQEEEIPFLKSALSTFKGRLNKDYATNLTELYLYFKDKNDKGEKMTEEANIAFEKIKTAYFASIGTKDKA